jgi:hypothetical protein
MISIEQRVMANVGVIHGARSLRSNIALEIYALAASAIALWQLTWVHKVFANFFTVERGGLGHVSKYSWYAFTHTHLMVQLSLMIGVVAFALLLSDILRRSSFRSSYRLSFR